MECSGRNYEFIEFQADKVLVAEIRPVRIKLKYQDEVFLSTKWLTFRIWQEIRKTLYRIVKEIEAGFNDAHMNIIKGESIVVGYQINPKNECLCTCSTPLETCDDFSGKYSGYELSPYLLRISVYPLKLDGSELELANTWVPKQYLTENIKCELLKALKGYVVKSPQDISNSKDFDLEKVTIESKKSHKPNGGRLSKLKARHIAVFGHDSEESIDSWQPVSKSESESLFSSVSLTDENSACDHVINKKRNVKYEKDSPSSPTFKQEETRTVDLESPVEKEKYELRERKLHSPGLRSKHRNNRPDSLNKNTPSVINVSKNLVQSHQIQNDKNSLADFDLESKYFKKKTRKRKSSGRSNLSKNHETSKLMVNLYNIGLNCNGLNITNDVAGNSQSSLSVLQSPSNVSHDSNLKKCKEISRKLSSKKSKLCSKENNFLSSFEKRQLRSSVSSDSIPEIPSSKSSQSLTKHKTLKLNTKLKSKRTSFSSKKNKEKTLPNQTSKQMLNDLLEEGSNRNRVSSSKKKRKSRSKRESIFNISSSSTQMSDSDTYTEVSRSSHSRDRIASLDLEIKKTIEDFKKPNSYDKNFLDLIVSEFHKLTREDMRLVLRQNRSYLEGIIRGEIKNDRDQKFLGSLNLPRVFTAQIFITVYEDDFYETLAFMIEEELGSCMERSDRDIPVIMYGLAVILPELMKKTLLSFPFVRERGITTDEECEDIFFKIMLNSSSIDDF